LCYCRYEYGVIEATVDGVKLKNLEQYRTQSGFFNITIVEGNIYESPVGTFRGLLMASLYFWNLYHPVNMM
jgi:hypothetical protein